MGTLTVNCPRCENPVKWSAESPYRPFCSERCKLMDLGAWATEKYAVPNDTPADDADLPTGQDDPAPRRDE